MKRIIVSLLLILFSFTVNANSKKLYIKEKFDVLSFKTGNKFTNDDLKKVIDTVIKVSMKKSINGFVTVNELEKNKNDFYILLRDNFIVYHILILSTETQDEKKQRKILLDYCLEIEKLFADQGYEYELHDLNKGKCFEIFTNVLLDIQIMGDDITFTTLIAY